MVPLLHQLARRADEPGEDLPARLEKTPYFLRRSA